MDRPLFSNLSQLEHEPFNFFFYSNVAVSLTWIVFLDWAFFLINDVEGNFPETLVALSPERFKAHSEALYCIICLSLSCSRLSW